MTVAPPWCGFFARRQTPSPTRKPLPSARVISWSYQSESADSFDVTDGSFTSTVSAPLPTSRTFEHRYTAFRSRNVSGSSRTVPPPVRATVSTAAWMTRWSVPFRSPFALPTVSVKSSSHFGPCRRSPDVARGFVTGGRASASVGLGVSALPVVVIETASAADADAVPRKRRRSSGETSWDMRTSGSGTSPECKRSVRRPLRPTTRRGRTTRRHDYGLAGSAFHTLMSSKYPSLPATPSSILDLVGWAIPEDLRYPAGLPSIVTRIWSPTVSTTRVYHLPCSSLAG